MVVVVNSSETVKPNHVVVKKDEAVASAFSSLLSPPPTVSVCNQASPMTMPLLTPPSPPPQTKTNPQPTTTSKDTEPVNGNSEHSTNPSISEILNQNEDSSSSMTSSSSTMSSASTSSSSSSSECAENINNKRKIEHVVKMESTEVTPEADKTDTNEVEASKKLKPIEPTVERAKTPEFVNNGDYMCEWNGCGRMFPTSKAVYNHVCKYHLLSSDVNVASHPSYLCLWGSGSGGCDQIRRQKWSLVNHLMERHCNENSMKTAIICRQRGINPVGNQQFSNSSSYLNYSPEAAQIAIQRNQKTRREDFYVRNILFII